MPESCCHVAISDYPVVFLDMLDGMHGLGGWEDSDKETAFALETLKENLHKRRRITSKSSIKRPGGFEKEGMTKVAKTTKPEVTQYVPEPEVTLKDLVKQVARSLPRVGARECQDPKLLQGFQALFPEFTVKKIIGCRGTDCERDPLKFDVQKQLPWLRSVIIHRTSGSLQSSEEWQNWSAFKTIKERKTKTAPAKVSVTLLGCKAGQGSEIMPTDNPVDFPPHGEGPSLDTPISPEEGPPMDDGPEEATPPAQHSGRPMPAPEPEGDKSTSHHTTNETKHGPKFLSLTAHQRRDLLKEHSSLGHPGTRKFKIYLESRGADPRLFLL